MGAAAVRRDLVQPGLSAIRPPSLVRFSHTSARPDSGSNALDYPRSNAHSPNEFLHLATGARLTACVARVLADHYKAGL